MVNPVWAVRKGARTLEHALELCEEEIKDLEKRKFSGSSSISHITAP